MNKKVILIFLLIAFNIILAPKIYAYENGREVFVRHINKANGEIINGLQNNTQEVKESSGKSTLLNNSTSEIGRASCRERV